VVHKTIKIASSWIVMTYSKRLTANPSNFSWFPNIFALPTVFVEVKFAVLVVLEHTIGG
jgi:uncharacterized membrane protein YhdT